MMIDAEIARLRKLRNRALRVRALAEVCGSERPGGNRAMAASAIIAWRVIRVVTGRLRAHPYLSYQNGPSRTRCWFNACVAFLIGPLARHRGRGVRMFAAQLRCFARELDDARSLSWEQDWSDTLGRAQRQLRRSMRELAGAPDTATHAASNARTRGDAMPSDWPYLAF